MKWNKIADEVRNGRTVTMPIPPSRLTRACQKVSIKQILLRTHGVKVNVEIIGDELVVGPYSEELNFRVVSGKLDGVKLVLNGEFFFGADLFNGTYVMLGLPENEDGETLILPQNPLEVGVDREIESRVVVVSGYSVLQKEENK